MRNVWCLGELFLSYGRISLSIREYHTCSPSLSLTPRNMMTVQTRNSPPMTPAAIMYTSFCKDIQRDHGTKYLYSYFILQFCFSVWFIRFAASIFSPYAFVNFRKLRLCASPQEDLFNLILTNSSCSASNNLRNVRFISTDCRKGLQYCFGSKKDVLEELTGTPKRPADF